MELIAKRWTRYGKDRVYVSTSAGERVGWLDLQDGSEHLEQAELVQVFRHTVAPFVGPGLAAERLVPGTPPPEVAIPTQPEDHDLAEHRPAQLVRAEAEARRDAMRSRSRIGTFLARALDMKTEERAYRVGAKGEEAIGARIERLTDRGWHVLHSIPVGKGRSDIDHLLIGPGGVYTVNTKNHPGKKVWVGAQAVLINGQSTRYLPVARFEADRARKLLSQAVGFEVPTKALLVFLTGTVLPQVTIKQVPDEVLVLDRMDVPRVFKRAPARLSAQQVNDIFEQARKSSLWR